MLTLMLHDTKHNSFRAHPNLWQALAGIFWQWNSNKIVVLFIFVIPVFTLIKPGLHAKFIAPTYGYMGFIMTEDSFNMI